MKKFPLWFSIYSPPTKPTEPPKTIYTYETVKEITLNTYSTEPFENIQADSISAQVEMDNYDNGNVSSVKVIFSNKKEIPNPNYASQYKYYLANLETYEERNKEWKKYKKEYDEEAEKQNKENRKKQYEKLKKEFESTTPTLKG